MTNLKPLQLPLFKPESEWRPPTELPDLAGAKVIAVDCEARDPRLRELGPGYQRGDAQVCGLSVAVEDLSQPGGGPRWYFPVRHREGDNLDPDVVFRWARSQLGGFDGTVVGAKLIYDLEALDSEGVQLKNAKRFVDVILAEPLLDEHKFEYDLDSLAEQYLGENKREDLLRQAAVAYGFGDKQRDVKGNLWQLPARYAGPYGEGDADLPLRVWREQEKRIEAEGLTEVFNVECRLLPLLLAMRKRGVRVDPLRAEAVRRKLQERVGIAIAKVRTLAGQNATLNSNEVLGAALEKTLGYGSVPRTKTGKFSIAKPFLERLVKETRNPLAEAILEGRKYQTVLQTFVEGAVLGHHVNGRVHCQFHQLKDGDDGTIARFSSSTPCLQNIPARDEELGPMMRSIFIPDEGEWWFRLDYSQIEYRMLAHYARGPGAREAREAYNRDPKTDYHKFVAEMLGVDPEDKVKRKRVKNTNFAKGYGAMAPKLAETFGCTIEEAEEFVAEYDAKLPFAKATFDAAASLARQRGWVRTILGRYGRFPLWIPDTFGGKKKPALPHDQAVAQYGYPLVRADTYMALNRVLQGSAADLMKKAMVDVWESGVCDVIGAPLLTVHDELDFSAPKTAQGLEAINEVKRIMEVALKLQVPVIAELESGPNWGECE